MQVACQRRKDRRPHNLGVPVLCCRTGDVGFSPGGEQVADIFFLTQFRLSGLLRVLISCPSFLDSLSRRSGLVFLPAWRGLAALSLPARPIHPFDHLSLLPLSRPGLVLSRRIFSILVRAEKFHTDIIVSDF